MAKTINDIAHELTMMKLQRDAQAKTNGDPFWTNQEAAELYQETHIQLLKELMQTYDTESKNYLV